MYSEKRRRKQDEANVGALWSALLYPFTQAQPICDKNPNSKECRNLSSAALIGYKILFHPKEYSKLHQCVSTNNLENCKEEEKALSNAVEKKIVTPSQPAEIQCIKELDQYAKCEESSDKPNCWKEHVKVLRCQRRYNRADVFDEYITCLEETRDDQKCSRDEDLNGRYSFYTLKDSLKLPADEWLNEAEYFEDIGKEH